MSINQTVQCANSVHQNNDDQLRLLMRTTFTANALAIDTDELRNTMGANLMRTSAAIASEFENDLINTVNEKVRHVLTLHKTVKINQRLSDSEKTSLLNIFSPPYKLDFSSNPTDIGSHMFYRALNEIATFRCYDLLDANEKIPEGYDMLIKEVGASIPKIIKYQRKYVHACTPNLSIDDTVRITQTEHTLVRTLNSPKLKNFALPYLNFKKTHRCLNKSQDCDVKCKYIILAHSSYDCSLYALANMMDSANAYMAIGFIHYSPKIISSLSSGSDNGLNWKTIHRNNCYFIEFWFDNDYQSAYVHNLDTYLAIIRSTVCTSRKFNTYIIQRTEELGSLLFYKIIKPIVNIPKSYAIRQLPYSDGSQTIIHYYKLQSDPSLMFYQELIPIKIVVPNKFFEKLYFYLETMPEGKFTTQNALIFASTLANRTIINGAYVTSPFALSIDQVENVAYATYFIVYCRRYDMLKTLSKLKGYEDLKRHPTFFAKIKNIFSNMKNTVKSVDFKSFKKEQDLSDVIANLKIETQNTEILQYSKNVLQWLSRLWRIGNRYDVRFYPVTRTVTIEEDIATFKSITTAIPYLFDTSMRDEITKEIIERLNITHVDSKLCEIDDEVCFTKLYPIKNNFEKFCVFRALANSLSMSNDDVVDRLMKSEYFERTGPVLQQKLYSYMRSGLCGPEIFELISLEFGINLCIHFESNQCKKYKVRTEETYKHFLLSDNHCTQLFERFLPEEHVSVSLYNPNFEKQEQLELQINTYLALEDSVRKTIKFKSYKYYCDNQNNIKSKAYLKLMEMNEYFNFLENDIVVELSAAPGSWIEFIKLFFPQSELYYSHYHGGFEMNGDLEAECLNEDNVGDLTDRNDFYEIFNKLIDIYDLKQKRPRVILSDIGIFKEDEDVVDEVIFTQFLENLVVNVTEVIQDEGTLLFKTYNNINLTEKTLTFMNKFKTINTVKPYFSNPLSSEYYIVCKGFNDMDNGHQLQNLHVPFLTKQFVALSRANRGMFPRQKKIDIPLSHLLHAPNQSSQVEEIEEIIQEDLPEPEIEVVENNLENDLHNQIKKLSLINCSEFGFAFGETRAPLDYDVKIFFLDGMVSLPDSIVTDDYIIHINDLAINVFLKFKNLNDAYANLQTVFTTLQTFKLNYLIDVSPLNNVVVEVRITQFAREFSHYNNIFVITHANDDVVLNGDISKYEKSIAELVSYNRSLRSNNINTYHYYYEQIKDSQNNVMSHTLLANLTKDTQNISIMFNEKFIFKHPKCKSDNYSHCFDGNDFVLFESVKDKIVLIGDYSHRMFDGQVTDKLLAIDVSKLASTQIIVIQGVAGHGKTGEIATKHECKLKTNQGKADLVLSPTLAGKRVLIERTCKVKGIVLDNLDQSYYKTITSYLLNAKEQKINKVYVDEVMMVHSAMILAVAYYSKADYIYLYGDTCQVPFHSSLGNFEFKFNTPVSLFPIKDVRHKSYRIPADVAATLDDVYVEQHKKFNFNKGIVTTSSKLKSLSLVKIGSPNEMLKYLDPEVVYLTFTHTTENELTKLNPEFKPQTIAAYQGSENKKIAIVRTSYSAAEKIYNDIHLCVTALTRHTDSMIYYTTCDLDTLSGLIKKANSMTDYSIKKFSTTLEVGSINYEVVSQNEMIPVYDTTGAKRNFFESRVSYTNKFRVFDYRRFRNPNTFVRSIINFAKNNKGVDIFVYKDTFKQFEMSNLRKIFSKFDPSIKRIYVKVRNQAFEENAEIREIVEGYKNNNVIQNTVTETLEQIIKPYFPQIEKIVNCIEIDPSIEMLQNFMCHLYPHCCFVNTTLDSYFVHSSDIEYTLTDVSLSTMRDVPKFQRYDKLKPVLSTPCPNIRDCTQREIILGIQKRNLNPPELISNSSPQMSSEVLILNFMSKLCIPGCDKVIKEMEPVHVTTSSVIKWLEKQDRTVLKAIQNDIPFFVQSLSDCALSLKRSPKIKISPDAIDVYDSIQTITYHPKFINAYFCSLVDQIQDRIMKCLLPYVMFNTKMNVEEFSRECHERYKLFNKLFLFSGDDSLLINGFKFKEMDMSKFDKSQLLFALMFLVGIFERFGMSPSDCQLYFEMMYFRICRDPSNKVTMFLTPQMESGCAATFIGNTLFCSAVIVTCLDLNSFNYTPQLSKFSMMFNLETKEFDFKNPYFCSKFLVISEDDFKFIPDPVKILIKLGRRDLINYEHVEEFHTSLLDLINMYENAVDIEILSAAIRERYGFPYSCEFHIRNLISVIKNKTVFKELYYHLPDDVLDSKLSKFQDYY
ncbi:ORF1 [Sandewavirus dungfly]|nr:ORF1 [Sandewavirus dungfly]